MQDAYVHKQGFTIVELLIVIVVVAILAAVSMAAYANISNRAHDSAVQSDLRSNAQKIEIYKVENGKYPKLHSTTELRATGLVASRDSYGAHFIAGGGSNIYNSLICLPTDGSDSTFAIVASSKSGKMFQYTREAGVEEIPYSWHGSVGGTCSRTGMEHDGNLAYRAWLYGSNKWQSWVN